DYRPISGITVKSQKSKYSAMTDFKMYQNIDNLEDQRSPSRICQRFTSRRLKKKKKNKIGYFNSQSIRERTSMNMKCLLKWVKLMNSVNSSILRSLIERINRLKAI